MKSIQDSVASWATLLGAVVSLIGLIQSQPWLVGVGAFFVAASVAALGYAQRERLVLQSARIRIEGRNIDSLNVANLRRGVNRSLIVQTVHRTVEIRGQDLRIASEYEGYCRAPAETAIEFSVDSDNNIPFNELSCFAFDLLSDPHRQHKIRPILIGNDGNSKKLSVPFLGALSSGQQFAMLLKCTLPGCMKSGVEYYASTLSFDQRIVRRHTVSLRFVKEVPDWVRVYECSSSGTVKLLKDLRPEKHTPAFAEYVDNAEGVNAQSTRVYVFRRA